MSVENGAEPNPDLNFQAQQQLAENHGNLLSAPEHGALQASAVEAAVAPVSINRIPAPQTSARPDYWKPPTAGQIENAAKYGFDLTRQSKY